MKKNSWPAIYWRAAKQSIKKPFLFIDRSFGRYSLTQDDTKKNKKKLKEDA